jgi:hypothetical protein
MSDDLSKSLDAAIRAAVEQATRELARVVERQELNIIRLAQRVAELEEANRA